jgi:hypothetical protein
VQTRHGNGGVSHPPACPAKSGEQIAVRGELPSVAVNAGTLERGLRAIGVVAAFPVSPRQVNDREVRETPRALS